MDVPKALAAAQALNRIAFGLGYLLRPEQARTSWIGRAARKPSARVMIRSQGARDRLPKRGARLAMGIAGASTLVGAAAAVGLSTRRPRCPGWDSNPHALADNRV